MIEVFKLSSDHNKYKDGMRYCVIINKHKQYFTDLALKELNKKINKTLDS